MASMEYKGWRASRREQEEFLSPSPARRLMATLNHDPDGMREGSVLPPLWHWLYFLPEARTDGLGEDGHPFRGEFMPPVDLPLRMFAGFELVIRRHLHLGERAWKSEQVTGIEEKHGKSGRLVFVTVSARVGNDGGAALHEKQTFVYRDAGPPAVSTIEESRGRQDWGMEVPISPPLLFRFSALTFNAHRIHYDREYAVNQEGYRGLVLHGPLIALLMADLVSRNAREEPTTFEFRQRAPVFEGDTLRLLGFERGDTDIELLAQRADGRVSATGRCTLA